MLTGVFTTPSRPDKGQHPPSRPPPVPPQSPRQAAGKHESPVIEWHPHIRVVHRGGQHEKAQESVAEGGEWSLANPVVQHHTDARVRKGDKKLQNKHGHESPDRVERRDRAIADLCVS